MNTHNVKHGSYLKVFLIVKLEFNALELSYSNFGLIHINKAVLYEDIKFYSYLRQIFGVLFPNFL